MKTRRILSLVVAAILVVSTLCVVGLLNVTAGETEITSAEQFATITDGEYKLFGSATIMSIGKPVKAKSMQARNVTLKVVTQAEFEGA